MKFSHAKILQSAAANPLQLALGVGLLIGLVYYLGRKTIGDAASGVGGILTGSNAITKGTVYENKGIVGTIASAANKTTGGALESIGEGIGGWFYDLTHTDYDPNTGLQTKADTVREGANNTDSLWGKIGSVLLRSN